MSQTGSPTTTTTTVLSDSDQPYRVVIIHNPSIYQSYMKNIEQRDQEKAIDQESNIKSENKPCINMTHENSISEMTDCTVPAESEYKFNFRNSVSFPQGKEKQFSFIKHIYCME
ncbi:hypothetical protein TrispH2_011486 [Trichoplax sp. H2]|nr:hypothetical protein TrispH2_011486 [Trichoplax sp. H2]|eukprot:RDD36747.1 hypothetical protein TrispH2_011486 [Trichoplax sp. H2]